MKSTLLKTALVSIAILLLASPVFSQKQTVKGGYRIEETSGKDSKGRESRVIKFISPSGKVIKRVSIKPVFLRDSPEGNLFYRETPVIVSGTNKYALEVTKVALDGNAIVMTRTLWNARASRKWQKTWRTYIHQADGDPNWDEGMSYDGTRIYVCYKDTVTQKDFIHDYWIIVYDTLGNEKAKVKNDGLFDVMIAPDGQVICATTGLSDEQRKGYKGPYLFLLDVETGKTKVIKAEGPGWSVGAGPLNGRKVEFSHYEHPGSIVLDFIEIPEDLSSLFKRGGEK